MRFVFPGIGNKTNSTTGNKNAEGSPDQPDESRGTEICSWSLVSNQFDCTWAPMVEGLSF